MLKYALRFGLQLKYYLVPRFTPLATAPFEVLRSYLRASVHYILRGLESRSLGEPAETGSLAITLPEWHQTRGPG